MSISLNFLGRIERQFLAEVRVPDGGKLGGKLSSRMFARLDFWLYFCRRIPTDIIHCDLMQLHDMQLIEGCASISCAALCAVTKRELFNCINLTN